MTSWLMMAYHYILSFCVCLCVCLCKCFFLCVSLYWNSKLKTCAYYYWMEYQGKLESSDAYMNLQLLKCEEYIDGELAGYLGEVLIRCNNILWIKAAAVPDDDGGDDEQKQE